MKKLVKQFIGNLISVLVSAKVRSLGIHTLEKKGNSRRNVALHLDGSFASATHWVFGEYNLSFVCKADADARLVTGRIIGKECVIVGSGANGLHFWHGVSDGTNVEARYSERLDKDSTVETATMRNTIEFLTANKLQVITDSKALQALLERNKFKAVYRAVVG